MNWSGECWEFFFFLSDFKQLSSCWHSWCFVSQGRGKHSPAFLFLRDAFRYDSIPSAPQKALFPAKSRLQPLRAEPTRTTNASAAITAHNRRHAVRPGSASRQTPRAACSRETPYARDSGAPPSYLLARSFARPFCFALRLRGAGAFRGRARCPPASAEEQEEGSRGAAGPRFPAKEKRERGPRGAAAARLVPPPSWRWASCPCRAASAEPGGSLGGQGEARREPGSRPAGRHGARRRRWWCCCRGGAGPGPLWMVVKMIIENFEALKSWLSKTLEPMWVAATLTLSLPNNPPLEKTGQLGQGSAAWQSSGAASQQVPSARPSSPPPSGTAGLCRAPASRRGPRRGGSTVLLVRMQLLPLATAFVASARAPSLCSERR